MTKQIDENSDWVKEHLKQVWDENQAEYFAKPSRLINKPNEANEKCQVGKFITNADSKKQKENSTLASKGMYACSIWENIRQDSKKKLKNFNLEKELQV